MFHLSTEQEILVWAAGGGGLLLLVLAIVICCSLCKSRHVSYFHPARRPINAVKQTYYDSFRQFEEYIINSEEIKTSQILGKGSYGTVYAGIYRGADVAVKKMRLPLHGKEGSQAFIAEVLALSKLRNRNIVQFTGICISAENPCIVMEFMHNGSVADKIHKEMRVLDWKTLLKWALDAAKGMEFLHAHKPLPIIHRDLKSDNLLVDENGLVKVGDFGTAKILRKIAKSVPQLARTKNKRNQGATNQSSFAGTVCWAAPEVVPPKPPGRRGPYTTAADVYSYGITLWEMISNKRPFRGYAFEFQIMDDIIKGVRPTIPSRCPDTMAEFLNNCWHAQKERRPSFQRIHETLNNLLEQIKLTEIANAGSGRSTFPPHGSLGKQTIKFF